MATQSLLVENSCHWELETGVQVEDAVVQPSDSSLVTIVVSNSTGCSTSLEQGTVIGEATEASMVVVGGETSKACPTSMTDCDHPAVVQTIQSVAAWKATLEQLITKPCLLDHQQTQELLTFLKNHYSVFCLDDYNRGETDLLEMEIDIED